MYGKLFILCLTCIMCLASGCSAKKNTSEPMTEVVVIQNSTTAAFAESADAATEMAENSVKESKAAGTAVSPFVEDMNYDIKDFIRQYYDYLAAGEYELAVYMTNDSTKLDREKFMELSGYIDSIKSLTCYMMDGMVEGSYIVVARCGVTTTLGAQVVTMLDAFYVCTNESGTYYICGGSVGDEVKSYNSIMLSDQKIAGVEKEVRLDNAAAVINQENLKEVAGIVINDEVRRYLYEQPAAE
ncbi:bacterial SH3 domain [Firmicutes bacterium CAG:882]|nr:bacterial SH3 domain [Firmicutes bacterium CAG:882]